MGKTRNKILITAAAFIAAGSALLGAGFMFGGLPYFYIDASGIHTPQTYEDTASWHTLEKTKLDAFEDIDLTATYANISVLPGDDYYIEYRLRGGKEEPSYGVSDGKFSFMQKPGGSAVRFTMISIGPVLGPSGALYEQSGYIRLYMPREAILKAVSLKTSDGKIEWENIGKLDSLYLENFYGNIYADSAEADSIELKTSDGEIKLDHMTASSQMYIKNAYSKIELSSITAGRLELKSSDGKIKLDHIRAGETEIKNSYGAVDIEDIEGSALAIEMSDGNVSVETGSIQEISVDNKYGDVIFDGVAGDTCKINQSDGENQMKKTDWNRLKIKNSYGNIQIQLKDGLDQYNYELDTKYGKISVDGDRKNESYVKNNNAQKEIQAECSDGSITIE